MRKYFTFIAVFIFMFCLFGCNSKMGRLFLDFNFDNMQVKVGEEVNIFALDYSTNVCEYQAIHVSSTDEKVVSVLENGDIEALCIGNCKIVVNIVSNGSLVTSSFDIIVVDNDIDTSNIDSSSGLEEYVDENESTLSFLCTRESANVFVLTILKNQESYYDFGYNLLDEYKDFVSISKYGTCLEIDVKNNGSFSVEIYDKNSNATTTFVCQGV